MEATSPINTGRNNDNNGFLVPAGTYSVEVLLLKDGKTETIVPATNFNVKALNNQTLVAQDQKGLQDFRAAVAETGRKVRGTNRLMNETKEKLDLIQTALTSYPNTDTKLLEEVKLLKTEFQKCLVMMNGDRTKSSREFETVPGINERLGLVEYAIYENTVDVSNTRKKNLSIVQEEYAELRKILDDIIKRTRTIEEKLDNQGIPYTKGKTESWKED
jgi:hypothetical protein